MKTTHAFLMTGALLAGLVSSSCSMLNPVPPKQTEAPPLPQTVAALRQGPSYEYRPLDPMTALVWHPDKVQVTNCRMLEMLPDETVRLATGHVETDGTVSYGPAKIGVKGERYVAILDYVKTDTFPIPKPKSEESAPVERPVPTYVGVGLRMTANFVVNEGSVDLGNLIMIGAAAQARQVTGTLVFQSLGLSGKNVVLPIPTDISPASIQQALVAIGTIKSNIYDDETQISPRIVGTYDVFGEDQKAFDAYFTKILLNPPEVRLRVNSRCNP
jgi:hypothetical protein